MASFADIPLYVKLPLYVIPMGKAMSYLELNYFLPLLNSDFKVVTKQGEKSFTLIEAKAYESPHTPHVPRTPFSLLFHCAAATIFPQDTYAVKHPQMGEFAIFLVPVAAREPGFVYQSVFN